MPSVLLEIGAGVVLGPSVLGWVEADTAVSVLSLIGVGFLLLHLDIARGILSVYGGLGAALGVKQASRFIQISPSAC